MLRALLKFDLYIVHRNNVKKLSSSKPMLMITNFTFFRPIRRNIKHYWVVTRAYTATRRYACVHRHRSPLNSHTQYASSAQFHTVVSGGEVLVQHPLHDLSDVVGQGLARAQVDRPLVHLVVSHGRALKDVECPPHISLGEGHQTLHPIRAHLYTARKLSLHTCRYN